MVKQDYDLAARAHLAMVEAGFLPAFGAAVLQEIVQIEQRQAQEPPPGQDLTHLQWSSIDNEESRDLDQLEYAERQTNGDIRLLIAIANVAHFVRTNGPIYLHAAHNTTSVYTGIETFHLMPEKLSTDRTSMLEDRERPALVVEVSIDSKGALGLPKVFQARVRNQARLTYDEVGEFIQDSSQTSVKIKSRPWIRGQLILQMEASRRLSALRRKAGALTYSSFEPKMVKRGGQIVDIKLQPHNAARELIESFMIAANISTAAFLKSKGWPIIERVVTVPRRWDRISQIAAEYGDTLPDTPNQKALSAFLAKERERDEFEFQTLSLSIIKLLGPGEYVVEYPDGPQQGHFGLAVDDYSHATAPNRRFADLVLQQLLRACLAGGSLPYGGNELQEIAARCSDRENAARKVERLMRKVSAAILMRERVGQIFAGVVTGASRKGVYARLFEIPAEGRVVQGEKGLDVGQRVHLKLIDVNIENGFIDFART